MGLNMRVRPWSTLRKSESEDLPLWPWRNRVSLYPRIIKRGIPFFLLGNVPGDPECFYMACIFRTTASATGMALGKTGTDEHTSRLAERSGLEVSSN
jgi:hypothetical protein